MVVTKDGRTFDYVPRLVAANNRYLIRQTATEKAQWGSSRWWVAGLVLDQGREGACVGFGCTGEAMASPVRQKFPAPGVAPVSEADVVAAANNVAVSVYHRCLQIDEYEGERDEGTSVRAGLLVGRERGWWGGFRWAKSLDELRIGLESGPVIAGVDWRDSMYETDAEGRVRIGGSLVGGHCLLITGYSPRWGRHREPVFRWRNSWGPSYGLHGNGYIAPADLDRILFRAGGEAAVVTDRKLVPSG